MADIAKYAITIDALEEDGFRQSSLIVSVGTKTGRPKVLGVHITSEDEEVDARGTWGGFDVDGLVDLLPKTGTVYEIPALPAVPQEPAPLAIEQPPTAEEIRAQRPGISKTALERERSRGEVDRISADLREGISIGRYRVGEPIPTRHELANMYPNFTKHSLRLAIKNLQDERLLSRGTATGTLVLRRPDEPPRKAAERAKALPAPRVQKATSGRATPRIDELLKVEKEKGSTGMVAAHYDVPYHTAYGWLKRAHRAQALANLPVVERPKDK